MNFRCVSVNSQLEHEFNSNLVYPQAILIDDINEDGKNEIVIGTANGEIFVYKGSLVQHWLKFSKQIGCITCMAFDSVMHSKKKYIIVHDAIGYVYLLSINQVYTRKRYASDISSANKNPTDWKLDLRLVHQSKLLINPKHMIIEDLYNTGYKQMILLYTDRKIRVFNWFSNLNASNVNPTVQSNHIGSNNLFQESGKFVIEQTWELPEQICSMHIIKDFINSKDLIATQPGGRAFILKSSQMPVFSNSSSSSSLTDLTFNNQSTASAKSTSIDKFEEVVNFLLESKQNCNLPSFLVGNVTYNKSNQYAYMITMSGDVYFFKMTPGSFPIRTQLWHRSINAIVLKCYKVDINDDDNEELMIATPDGQIFSINCAGDILCFDLGEPIRAFHIGLYSSELFRSSISLVEPGTSSEIDLCQSNQSNPAFELALNLDASPISFQNDESSQQAINNSLCAVFISTITNKICLLQTEAILPYSKTKPSNSQFKYKCENIFTKTRSLNSRLGQAIENGLKRGPTRLPSDIIHNILYS